MAEVPAIVLYGGSSHSVTVAHRLARGYDGRPSARVVAFIDDGLGEAGLRHDKPPYVSAPVISFASWARDFRDVPCAIALTNPALKRRLAGRVLAAGGRFAALYAPPEPFFDVTVGAGSLIFGGASLETNCTVGEHVQIMTACAIGHDVTVGDCTTISGGTIIAGYVRIEADVFIGVGAVIRNGREGHPLVIGTGATVGAGAVVMKSVPAGAVVMGNPARRLRELARGAGG